MSKPFHTKSEINKPQAEGNVNSIINIFNYCRFASYSEFAFQFLFIFRNTKFVFVKVR